MVETMRATAERPNDSHEEYLLTRALQLSQVPAEMIRTQPSPLTIVPFPPRFGHPQGQPTIHDVLDVERLYRDRRDAWTGSPGGYAGTSTPSMGTW